MTDPIDINYLSQLFQIDYYDQRTDYLWKHATGHSELLGNTPKLSIDSFEVMAEILEHRTLNVARFMWAINNNPKLSNLECHIENGTLIVNARTFTFSLNTQTCIYRIEAYDDVTSTLKLENASWSEQRNKPTLFSPQKLDTLDKELYERYTAQIALDNWASSAQYQVDFELAQQIISYLMTLVPRLNNIMCKTRLNIMLTEDEKLRIGMCTDYSANEILSLQIFERNDWKAGVDQACITYEQKIANELDQIVKENRKQLNFLQVAIQNKEVRDAQKVADLVDCNYADSLITYGRALEYEAMNLPYTPKVMYWKTDNLFQGNINSVARVAERISEVYPNWNYIIEGNVVTIELDNITATYDITGRRIYVELTNDVLKVCNLPILVAKSSLPKVGINIYRLDFIDQMLHQEVDCYKHLLEQSQSDENPAMLEATKCIMKEIAPFLQIVLDKRKKYDYRFFLFVKNVNFDIFFDLDDERFSRTFKADEVLSQFRSWWSTTLMNHLKTVKDRVLNPLDYYKSIHNRELPF